VSPERPSRPRPHPAARAAHRCRRRRGRRRNAARVIPPHVRGRGVGEAAPFQQQGRDLRCSARMAYTSARVPEVPLVLTRGAPVHQGPPHVAAAHLRGPPSAVVTPAGRSTRRRGQGAWPALRSRRTPRALDPQRCASGFVKRVGGALQQFHPDGAGEVTLTRPGEAGTFHPDPRSSAAEQPQRIPSSRAASTPSRRRRYRTRPIRPALDEPMQAGKRVRRARARPRCRVENEPPRRVL
jgi:hypothetical protein